MLKTPLKAVSEAPKDFNLSNLQTFNLQTGGRVVSYSNQKVGLVSQIGIAGHCTSKIEI